MNYNKRKQYGGNFLTDAFKNVGKKILEAIGKKATEVVADKSKQFVEDKLQKLLSKSKKEDRILSKPKVQKIQQQYGTGLKKIR